MKKQKICIIGSGLTGLTAALVLSNLNIEIDLYYSKKDIIRNSDKRITAISQSNFNFISENIKIKKKNFFWPCKKINLFYETKDVFLNFLNLSSEKNFLMYIFDNGKYKQDLFKKIKTKKNIKLINDKVTSLDINKNYLKTKKNNVCYDQAIMCLGVQSSLYYDITKSRSIFKDYKEIAVTGFIKHSERIENPRQYFLKDGPLAILPFNKSNFSFVWSLNKYLYIKNKIEIKKLIEKKISYLIKNKKKLNITNIQTYPIYLNLQNKYYKKNILILGEGLHSVHPIAGQGFNLVLRDIKTLFEVFKKNLNLGFILKNSFAFQEFYSKRKPENTMLGLGIDLTNSFFKQNKMLDPIKEQFIKNLKKYKSVEKLSKIISDKGLFDNY